MVVLMAEGGTWEGEKRHGAVSTNDLSDPFTYFQTLERRADGRNGQGVDGSPPH